MKRESSTLLGLFCALFLLFPSLPLSGADLPFRVLHMGLSQPIHSVSSAYLERGVQRASREGYDLVLLSLDTPGGLDRAMRKMIQTILSSPVPVAVYVSPSGGRAASAGFFLLQAGDIAAMAPGTQTGAAHPVNLFGKSDPVMETKVMNDAVSFIRNLAEKRGRDPAGAEATVRNSRSFTDREALEGHLIDLVSPTLSGLLNELRGRRIRRFSGLERVLPIGVPLVTSFPMNRKESFLSFLADPGLAYLLLMVGVVGVFVACTHPGGIVAGLSGGVCLIFAAMAFQILPINVTGLFLIILSVCLFIAEIKVQGFGVLGIGGAIAMVLGSVILIDAPVKEMRMPLSFVLPIAFFVCLCFLGILLLVYRTYRRQVATGKEGLVGEEGNAVTDLSPSGKVFVHGEWWDALSEVPVLQGERVVVIKKEGMLLRVEPKK